VDPVDRRVAVQYRIEVRRRLPARRTTGRLTAGDPVRDHRVGPEPGRHIAAGQFGELTDGSNPHAPQQVHQLLPTRTGEAGFGGQLPDGQWGEELRIAAGFDDPAGAGGEHRGGQLVGDADLAFGTSRRHRVDQPFRDGLLGAEVAGRPAYR